MKHLFNLCIPFALAILNILTWPHVSSSHLLGPQVWVGAIALCAFFYASGLLWYPSLKPANLFRLDDSTNKLHPWVEWVLMGLWTAGWLAAWLTLPSGSFLKFLLPASFFTLMWSGLGSCDSVRLPIRRSMAVVLAVGVVLTMAYVASRTFVSDRIWSDWFGPIDTTGRHYQHFQVLKTWNGLMLWGASPDPLSNARFTPYGMELLQIMRLIGLIPGLAIAVTLLLSWWALGSWLSKVKPGPAFSVEMRRLGVALLSLHGLAALAYVLFNLGISRQSAGLGLPPFVPMVAWWIMGSALGLILIRAMRQARANQNNFGAKHWWISFTGYVASGLTLGVILLLLNVSQRDSHVATHPSGSNYLTRSVIRDGNENVIAQNVVAYDIWFNPSEFWSPSLLNPKEGETVNFSDATSGTDAARKKRLIDALAKWPQTRGLVLVRLENWPKSKDSLAILAWAVPPEIAEQVKSLDLQGLVVKQRTARSYPGGALHAHAVGFASLADTQYGQEGLELVSNYSLQTVSPDAGASDQNGLNTTLVRNIQQSARDVLQAGVSDNHAIGGAVVVIDVEKNEIAAMVSAPDFDPNDHSTYRNPYQPDRILNRATSLGFPIGALITPLIAAHGIESGRVTAKTTVNLGAGPLRVGTLEVRDTNFYGALTVEEIIAKSSNIGLAKLAMQLPLAELQGVSQTLGLGEPLAISGLTGGAIAERRDWSEWTPAMHATPGQSIETNLMQVLKAYLPIAASGYLRIPTLLASSHGEMYGKRVLSPETAATIRQALKLGASDRGTAPLAQVSGATVAGKTATMTGNFWRDPVSGKKLPRSDTSVFVGMLPAEQPKWLVGVMLEYQAGKAELAGLSTAPMFAHLARLTLSPLVGETQAVSLNVAH